MSQKTPKKKKNYTKSTVKVVLERRAALKETIDEARKKGIPISRDYLITELEKRDFKSNRNILYDDRTALNREGNTFIADLTEANYSQYMQDIFEKLIWIEDESMIQYNKKWTNSKLVTKNNGEKGEQTEKHITGELAQPKAAFLGILRETQKLKYEFLSGNNVHLSAALIAQKFQVMQQHIYELEEEAAATKKTKPPLLNPSKEKKHATPNK